MPRRRSSLLIKRFMIGWRRRLLEQQAELQFADAFEGPEVHGFLEMFGFLPPVQEEEEGALFVGEAEVDVEEEEEEEGDPLVGEEGALLFGEEVEEEEEESAPHVPSAKISDLPLEVSREEMRERAARAAETRITSAMSAAPAVLGFMGRDEDGEEALQMVKTDEHNIKNPSLESAPRVSQPANSYLQVVVSNAGRMAGAGAAGGGFPGVIGGAPGSMGMDDILNGEEEGASFLGEEVEEEEEESAPHVPSAKISDLPVEVSREEMCQRAARAAEIRIASAMSAAPVFIGREEDGKEDKDEDEDMLVLIPGGVLSSIKNLSLENAPHVSEPSNSHLQDLDLMPAFNEPEVKPDGDEVLSSLVNFAKHQANLVEKENRESS